MVTVEKRYTTVSTSQKRPSRRYVLEDPYKTTRTSRKQTTIVTSNGEQQRQNSLRSRSNDYFILNGQNGYDEYDVERSFHNIESTPGTPIRYIDETNRTNRTQTIVVASNDEQQRQNLLKFNSNDYFILNGQNGYDEYDVERSFYDIESSPGTPIRYFDNNSIEQILEMNEGGRTLSSSRSLQSLVSPDMRYYPINVDPNPELIVRSNGQRVKYRQDVSIRYLRPPTPPPPGPIIIREVYAPSRPVAPPVILRQRPRRPRTPSPIIIRERPPDPPERVPTTVIQRLYAAIFDALSDAVPSVSPYGLTIFHVYLSSHPTST
ncbi:unnamed protein product [Didymodactylos carnosus]|uniref:Uncharacterized protein n=1 Tax=Didymodactylos carnosus TaxID=1234261 RepID=A0A8S2ES64_9BILA|nr:unnamed protein product [Didymodactylos carnosus]CAF4100428.1 unnamed protein product [Didymodactylos carnosus]